MATRRQNEKQFGTWLSLENGGRIYKRVVKGRHNWTAIYCKEVDAGENTIRFWQEIRDENGELREIHEKYPIDKGHIKL